jgi:putative ABC transport system permease protein
MKDFRLALRQLLRSPGFTLLAIITLGLGIGANTSTFSMVNGIFLKPLPYSDSAQLDRIYRATPQNAEGNISPADFRDLQHAENGYGHFAAYTVEDASLSEPGYPAEMTRAGRATANFFSLLGVQPQVGRDFRPGEDAPRSDRVVILSQRTWRNRFELNPNVIGRTIRIDGEPHQVIGVLPATFNDWRHLGGVDFFRPLALDQKKSADRRSTFLRVIGRRSAAYSRADAAIERANYQSGVLRDMLTAFAVLGLGLASLGIYGVIARTMAQRAGEFAIRLALGARIENITRLVLTSGVKLALLGSAIGLLGALGVTRVLAAGHPNMRIHSLPVLIGTTLLLIAIALLACWLPARRAGRIDAMSLLRAE